jgi:hypothetical protein
VCSALQRMEDCAVHILLEEYWNVNIDFQESVYKQAHLVPGFSLSLSLCKFLMMALEG